MSTNINSSDLRNFIIKNINNKLDYREAKELDIEDEYNAVAEELDTVEIDIDDIIDNKDLYEQFAIMYTTEQEKKAEAKDKDKEKEEQTQVKDKNQAGV